MKVEKVLILGALGLGAYALLKRSRQEKKVMYKYIPQPYIVPMPAPVREPEPAPQQPIIYQIQAPQFPEVKLPEPKKVFQIPEKPQITTKKGYDQHTKHIKHTKVY